MSWASSPALPRAADGVAQPLYLGVAEIDVGHPEECGDSLFRGVAEVCADDVREHIFAGGLSGLGGIVYVARSVFPMCDQLFLAEDTQDRSHCGIRRRGWGVPPELGNGRAPTALE